MTLSKYELMKKSFLIIVSCLLCNTLLAQVEATMYFMRSLPQVTYTNPAVKPAYKFSLGIPGSSIYGQASNNGFSYKTFITDNEDSTVGDINKLYRSLKKKNYLSAIGQVDIFRFSLKVNPRIYLTVNATIKSYNRTMVPKDLFGVVSQDGIPNLKANTSISISPQVESTSYAEFAAGASYVVDRNLTVGLRLKSLRGIINATTVRTALNLDVDGAYNINASADADVRTSGIKQLNDDFDNLKDNPDNYLKNKGFAFDLGATYKMMDERLTLGFALLDVGGITWKNDTYGYKLDPKTAQYTTKGIDIQKILNDDNYINDQADSISNNFQFKEGTIGSYRTTLPKKIYLSGSYALRKNLYMNALIFAETFKGRFSPGISASLYKDVGRRLSASISYTATNRAYNNIGAGLSFNFAPLQLYIVGDNLLRAPFIYLRDGSIDRLLESSKFANVRVGLNFVFGWDKSQEKLPYPKNGYAN
jgi:hypothetical protein